MEEEKKAIKHYESKERKFTLPKGSRFDTRLLPILQNLTAIGMTESDIGMVVGYQGPNARDWLANAKRKNPDCKLACEAGAKMADAFLVSQMFRSAVGYDFKEEKWGYDKAGNWVKKEEHIKHQPGNAQLAIFMATNRMPEQFKNRVDITKKGIIIGQTKEVSAEQIEKLAGALMSEARKLKAIDGEIIDVSSESD